MSKAKSIGTRAETAVRNFLLSAGYSELDAHRNVLKGSDDEGDVWLRTKNVGLVVFEIKGGNMAKTASHNQILKWYEEADLEKKNAKGSFGFLVVQRAGVGYPRAGEWWAFARLADLIALDTNRQSSNDAIVRLTLSDLIELIKNG
jgi:hypothetical protein